MRIIRVAKKNIKYDSGWTAVLVPSKIAKDITKMAKKIPDRELYKEDDGSKGREDQHHITIQYGIKNDDFEKVQKLFEDQIGGEIILGELSIFESDKFDVLKISVKTNPKLRKFKRIILENLKCEDKYPKYMPHITIAYLNSGAGEKYVEEYKEKFNGISFEFDSIVFKSKLDKDFKVIKLNPS